MVRRSEGPSEPRVPKSISGPVGPKETRNAEAGPIKSAQPSLISPAIAQAVDGYPLSPVAKKLLATFASRRTTTPGKNTIANA